MKKRLALGKVCHQGFFKKLIIMLKQLNSEEYIVVEFTSSAGNKFEVGYPKSAGYTKENLEEELAKSSAKSTLESGVTCEINCPPDQNSWISQCARDIGIVQANVWSDAHALFYCYQLVFTNTTGWGFTFWDASGDDYNCSTPRNAPHYINYNSTDATMVKVSNKGWD